MTSAVVSILQLPPLGQLLRARPAVACEGGRFRERVALKQRRQAVFYGDFSRVGFLFCQKDYDRRKKDFYEYVALAF